jgi:hypothetical protein
MIQVYPHSATSQREREIRSRQPPATIVWRGGQKRRSERIGHGHRRSQGVRGASPLLPRGTRTFAVRCVVTELRYIRCANLGVSA